MKRILLLTLSLVFAAALIGCGAAPAQPTMEIKPAELSQEQQDILRLVGGNAVINNIFDYTADDSLKSASVYCYRLENGQWVENGGGSFGAEEPTGRLAISFDNLGGGMRVAFQSGGSVTSMTDKIADAPQEEGMGRATSWTSQVPIEYEKEIPLAIQIVSSKGEILSYSTEHFFQPEKYVEKGYEQVYAVTVTFSQEELR